MYHYMNKKVLHIMYPWNFSGSYGFEILTSKSPQNIWDVNAFTRLKCWCFDINWFYILRWPRSKVKLNCWNRVLFCLFVIKAPWLIVGDDIINSAHWHFGISTGQEMVKICETVIECHWNFLFCAFFIRHHLVMFEHCPCLSSEH